MYNYKINYILSNCLIASYGANVHKSVLLFRTIFFILARLFESVETSSGFACRVSDTFLPAIFFGEVHHLVLNFRHLTIFFFKNYELLEILLKVMESERKTCKLTVWNIQ